MKERRIIFILWLVLLTQGIVFALIQPVWSRVDEAQHFHYVQFLAENRRLPVEGETFISPEVVDVSLRFNQWGWRPVGTLSTPVYLEPTAWEALPSELSDQDQERWVRRNLWYFNYEAMQPPLYYAVNTPVYAALPADSLARLYGMRLLAALMASAMVPLAWLTAREAYPESRLAVYGAPVAMLLVQGYALNMSQITNDALAVPLAAAAVLLLLRLVSRGLSWKRSLAAGVLISASLLAKMTTIFLIPVALAALAMLFYRRREKPAQVLVHGGILFGAAALILAPWVAHNLVLYGDATGASEARPLMSSFFISPLVSVSSLRLEELLPTFWFGEPVFPFAFWNYAWVAAGTALAVAVVGMLFYYLRPANGVSAEQDLDSRLRIDFVVAAFLIGVAVNLLLPFGSGIGGVPGRYLYAILPVGAFLLLFGMERLLGRERAHFMAEALLIWMVVWESLNFLAYVRML